MENIIVSLCTFAGIALAVGAAKVGLELMINLLPSPHEGAAASDSSV